MKRFGLPLSVFILFSTIFCAPVSALGAHTSSGIAGFSDAAVDAVAVQPVKHGVSSSSGQPVKLPLDGGWSFRQARGYNWYPATVPGTVHTDLMAAGIISDPYLGLNERGVQWVDKEDWIYRTTFDVPADVLSRDVVTLVFEGLDTYAAVKLNGERVLTADNMFCRWEVDVKALLKPAGNELEVSFDSPIRRALPLWEATPWRQIIESGNDQSQNGGIFDARVGVFVRKAGYHFGWDWGPRLVTSGIWRPVFLEAWNGVRIGDVFYTQKSVDVARAEVEVTVDLELAGGQKDAGRVEIRLNNLTDGKRLAAWKGRPEDAKTIAFTIENPRLWWTNGLGEPFLYEFEVELLAGGKVIDSRRQKLGLRSVKVVAEPDRWGESFYVELNGVPVFMKGANYIPGDVFLPRVTPEKYEKTIRDAVLSNMNMLRVWGGGIYENEIFYDLCDAGGILVWQDFMFACALYPAEGELLENIRREARQNVRRLRNHTCIALWCGNNECLDMWFHWGVKRRFDRTNPEWSAIQWEQFKTLYYKDLPAIVAAEHPGVAYRKSSPYSDDLGLRSDSIGDYHDWDVWGQGLEFERFNTKRSRFFSEYGFQGFPSMGTVKRFAPAEKDWSATSEVMLSHQRAGTNGNQKIERMMLRDYGVPVDFEAFTYLSQLMQADAMRTAMEAHRRQMPRCMGSLIWQLNDCWPAASWSGVDFFGNWKGQQYAVRRSFADILISPVVEDGALKIYAVSDRAAATAGKLTIGIVDGRKRATVYIEIPARSSNLVWSGDPGELLHIEFAEVGDDFVPKGRVYENNFYPAKHKDMHYPEPNIEVRVVGDEVFVTSDVFARGVCLVADENDAASGPGVPIANFSDAVRNGDPVIFSDNFFDLQPGETRKITLIQGCLTAPPRVLNYAGAVSKTE